MSLQQFSDKLITFNQQGNRGEGSPVLNHYEKCCSILSARREIEDIQNFIESIWDKCFQNAVKDVEDEMVKKMSIKIPFLVRSFRG